MPQRPRGVDPYVPPMSQPVLTNDGIDGKQPRVTAPEISTIVARH